MTDLTDACILASGPIVLLCPQLLFSVSCSSVHCIAVHSFQTFLISLMQSLRQQKLQYNTGPAPLSLLANLNVPAALHCKFLRKQWESTGCSSNTCPLPTGWTTSANHCSHCWVMHQTAIEQWLAAQAGTMHLNGLFCPSQAQQQACKHTATICKARTS